MMNSVKAMRAKRPIIPPAMAPVEEVLDVEDPASAAPEAPEFFVDDPDSLGLAAIGATEVRPSVTRGGAGPVLVSMMVL